MIWAELVLGSLLTAAGLYFEIAALMNGYYSLYRLALFKKDRFRAHLKTGLGLLALVIATIILPLIWTYLAPIALIVPIFTLLLTTKEQLKFTRRSTTLFILSSMLAAAYFAASYLIFDKIFFVLPFFSLFVFGLVSLASLLDYPLEVMLRRRYFRRARRRLSANPNLLVIGVTGSYGKTTTRNFLAQFLKDLRPLTPSGNVNTPLGLTHFINDSLSPFDRLLLIEIGVDRPGGMKRFKKFLRLDCAVVTAVGPQHMRTFHTLENIRREKLAIAELVKPGGKLFYEQSSVKIDEKRRRDIEWVSYSANEYSVYQTKAESTLIYLDQALLEVPLLSIYSLLDSFGAYKVALNYVNADRLKVIYQQLALPNRRKKVYRYPGLTVIDDSYNINLLSFRDSMALLMRSPAPRQVVTTGLVEIGSDEAQLKSFFTELERCDRVYFTRAFSQLEKKILAERPELQRKIVRQDPDALEQLLETLTGTLLLLTTGTKFTLS